ncbi:MAG: hypothetical protein U0929_13560 [Planctomycetaceae bacterium]
MGIATGAAEVEPDEVLCQLDENGKTLEDLARVTDAVKERTRLAALAAEFEARRKASVEASQEFAAANEHIEAERMKLDAKFREAATKASNADANFRAADSARRELLATCDPELQAEIADVRHQFSVLMKRRSEVQLAIEQYQQTGDSHMELTASEELKEIGEQAEQLQTRIDSLEREAMRPESVAV